MSFEIWILLAISTLSLTFSVHLYFKAYPSLKILELHQEALTEITDVLQKYKGIFKLQERINIEFMRKFFPDDTAYKEFVNSLPDKTSDLYKYPSPASQDQDQQPE